MIRLLQKDLYLIKKGYLLSTGLTLLLSLLCLNWKVDMAALYIFSSILAFLIVINGNLVSVREEEATYFLLTLPIGRNEFVLAKYISTFLLAILNWLTTSVILLISFLPGVQASFTGATLLEGLYWSIGLTVIIASFFLPVYYSLGYRSTRLLLVTLFILTSFISPLIQSTLFQHIVIKVSSYSIGFLTGILIVLSLVIFAASAGISLVVVNRKKL